MTRRPKVDPEALTEPQFRALAKWEKGSAHPRALGVRDDMAMRLTEAGLLGFCGMGVRKLTPSGVTALALHRQPEDPS